MSGPTFPVRAFVDGDLQAAADLWVATWAATMPDIDFEARRPWFLEHLAKLRAAGARVLVAEVPTDAIAGFVIIDPATRYLDQLAVAPGQRGGGAAEALMAAARAVSPGGIVLDVNQDNGRAVAFYRRSGFRIVSAGENPMSGRAIWRMEWAPDGIRPEPVPAP
ncbi:GNAT family N-acetyltransferase [Azorhizobium doebereinerae]|uniref:GNAT family N-acetyltransferase n=1 Tax=Azorhizobium doebereinerae TaxID=281091 RepID=UPI0004028A70|nr:GNAT family N-acetyltransferase [Azorhizobium doebereinerae]